MTRQETFDKVVSGLRKQGRKSVDADCPVICRYRGLQSV